MHKKTLFLLFITIILTTSLSGCTDQKPTPTIIDTDGDGYTDDVDAFPSNSNEWNDTDNDGYGDNTDVFPQNASEWNDTDNDGYGDNIDYYPTDNTRWKTPETISIHTNNTTHTINTTKEIILMITASSCTITVNQHTPLIQIIIQGNNNNIHLSINHSYTLDNTGTNNEITFYDQLDPIIQQALPYLQKINTNNQELKELAQNIISGCSSKNHECQITALYRYIIENYNLTETGTNTSLQNPLTTIQKKQGTQNDLTLLLNSLLENSNIPTYLALVNEHVYTFIPNVDPQDIWTYSESALITQLENDWGEEIYQTYTESFQIASAHARYFGGADDPLFTTYIDNLTLKYLMNSNHPLHLYVVKTYSDFINFTTGNPFEQYTDYEKTSTSGILNRITINTYGGIVLFNEGLNTANVTIDLELTFTPFFNQLYSQENITDFSFNGQTGIILDVTLGDYGFPGNDEKIDNPITIISVKTKEYYTIS